MLEATGWPRTHAHPLATWLGRCRSHPVGDGRVQDEFDKAQQERVVSMGRRGESGEVRRAGEVCFAWRWCAPDWRG